MAFHVFTPEERDAMYVKPIESDRRLFLDESMECLVEADDPRARHLLAGAKGSVISPVEVKRLRLELVDGRVVQRPAEQKEMPAPEDKHLSKKESKGRK